MGLSNLFCKSIILWLSMFIGSIALLPTASGIDITVPELTGRPGAYVTLPVNIGDTTGLGIVSVEITLTYNTGILTATSVSTENTVASSSGWGSPTYNIIDGQVIIWMAHHAELTGVGALVRINFTISGTANNGDTTLLALSNVSLNEHNIPVTTTNGSLTVDSAPPETVADLSGMPGESGWYISDVIVELSATDTLSDVKETRYKINGGAWQIYSLAFAISSEGTTTVYYYSEDSAGNTEAGKSTEIKIDKTAPDAPAVTDDGDSTSSTTQLHASWISSDPESGIVEYQCAIGTTLDENNIVDWTSVGTVTEVTKTGLSLTSGETYFFAVKAKNEAGTWSSVGSSDGIMVQIPQIGVTPMHLVFYALVGSTNPDAQKLNITNPGSSTLNWTVSDNADWLSLSPTSGDCTDETDEVMVSVDITGLTPGIYNAAITISATNASNTPQTVSVTLRVLSMLTIQAFCPVDLVVTDPKGRIVKKDEITIPSWPGLPPVSYTKGEDLNGDGDPDVEVRIPGPVIGDYLIEVVPEPDAKPTDAFTLSASYRDESKILADNVEIQDIPTDPYSSFMPECDVDPGWNLISIPVKSPNNALDTVLQSIMGHYSSVWAYDAEGGEWKRHIVDGPDFLNNLDTVEAGKGYCIQMTDPAVLTLDGDEVADDPISLKQGWNLVGYNYPTARSVEEALSSITGKYSSVWTFADSEWRRYIAGGPGFLNNLEVMEPGKGYWINAIVDCIWTSPARVGSIFTISIP